MSLEAGTKLGPYELKEKIGSGGMGDVYRATDTRLNREVAIKLVSDAYLVEAFGSGSGSAGTGGGQSGSGKSGTPGTVSQRRFLREAQASSSLNHPNICTIHDIGTADIGEQAGRPYLVMELLRGVTLKEALRGAPLSVTEVVTFSRQIAAALAAAHEQGIVHRDIKPANLFVVGAEGRRQIKVLDFGLAKQQGAGDLPSSGDATAVFGGAETMAGTVAGIDLTSPGSTLGTVAYMSPEQAEGLPLDARTDLFSLGSVVYEMATGKTPFAGGSAAAIFAALLRENPAPISAVRAGQGLPPLPAGFDAIVTKLLEKDKALRYQRAADVEKDLEDLSAGQSTAASSASGRYAVPAKPEAARGKLLLVAAAVVVVLLAAGGAWWKFHGPTPMASGPAAGAADGAVVSKKDSIILADFVNRTGDPVFDTTLNQALQIELEQSPVINIVSQSHLRQSVKFLGKPADTLITPDIAREIGEREGVKAILTGTIATIGTEYVVTLAAQNTATGDEIASEQAQAVDKNHVLEALGKAATAMRAKLGEDLGSIKRLDTPFGQATTTSLEAFRAYALGDVAHQLGNDIPEAEGHYLRAIELDPNFAMAYARLGVVNANSGQISKAVTYFNKAYGLSKNVSERERLYISAHYENNVTGNIPKQIETLEESIQAYPGQLDNYININVAYSQLGQNEKGLPYALKAVAMAPEDTIASENLLGDYLALNRLQDAKLEVERARKLGLDASTGYLAVELPTYWMRGETAEVSRIEKEGAGRPDEFVLLQSLSQVQQLGGQFHLANATAQRAFDSAGRAKAPDAQAGILALQYQAKGFVGVCEGNEAAMKRALTLDRAKQTQEFVAAAAAVCGNAALSVMPLEELEKKYPEDTLLGQLYLPLTRALVGLSQGHAAQAVQDAEPTKAFNQFAPGSYVEGLGYLQLHDSAHALVALQTAAQYPTNSLGATSAPILAPAQLALARAYVMAGDKANAKKAYDAFFLTWKNADADLPLLVAAKKEYAALQE
jgi:serine/threonine protein kinase/tetratricopeptide (TPR) repeat protein